MTLTSDDEQPDFSTLSAIMDRFRKVPFAQFRSELDSHFKDHFDSSHQDLPEEQRERLLLFRQKLMELTNDLFCQSDVLSQCHDLLNTGKKNDER